MTCFWHPDCSVRRQEAVMISIRIRSCNAIVAGLVALVLGATSVAQAAEQNVDRAASLAAAHRVLSLDKSERTRSEIGAICLFGGAIIGVAGVMMAAPVVL